MRTPAEQLHVLLCGSCGLKATKCGCREVTRDELKAGKPEWSSVPVWTREQLVEAADAAGIDRRDRHKMLTALEPDDDEPAGRRAARSDKIGGAGPMRAKRVA